MPAAGSAPICGICTLPGETCAQVACELDAGTTQCGPAPCPAGLECCNESCGICAEPGQVCTQQLCEPAPDSGTPDSGKLCGPTLCAPELECCNESCGICTEPGEVCTQIACS
jgi:hypothetical protein